MIRRIAISLMFLVGMSMLSWRGSTPPVYALGGLSVSSLEGEIYEDGDVRLSLEETFLLRFTPPFSILSRVGFITQEGWNKTDLSVGPVIVFASGIYGELIYTLSINDAGFDHTLAGEVFRETGKSIASLGGKAARIENDSDYVTISTGLRLFPAESISPGAKYYFTFDEDLFLANSLWLSAVISPFEFWQFTPSFTPTVEQKKDDSKDLLYGFSTGVSAKWQPRPLLSMTARLEYRDPAIGRRSTALMVLLDLRW